MAPVAIVTGCRMCPLEATLSSSYGGDDQHICQHPDGRDSKGASRYVAPENEPAPETPPDWCPLRSSALIVQLASPTPQPMPQATPTKEK